MKKKTLGIIGGGASGMLAAISAAKAAQGKINIIIFERLERIGKKLLATGNGRCNYTNVEVSSDNFYGTNPAFVNTALESFTVNDTINFFNSLGVFPIEEGRGKVFPYSGQASAVLDALRSELDRLGIEIKSGFDVKEIKKGFRVNSYSGESCFCNALIICGGGCASPNLGSNGSALKLLEALGHTSTKLSPALVQMITQKEAVKGLSGIKVNANATLIQGGFTLASEEGEILFTDYGLSGPPIFQLSTITAQKKGCTLSLDFMREYPYNAVYDILLDRCEKLSHLTMEGFFTGLLNKRIGNLIARGAGIEKLSLSVSALTKDQIRQMARLIKDYPFEITGNNSWNNAQVTAGGILTSEFNKETLESRLVKGIYAAGEVLDIYGDCGGYNLQWAWSSGYLAGRSSALSLTEE